MQGERQRSVALSQDGRAAGVHADRAAAVPDLDLPSGDKLLRRAPALETHDVVAGLPRMEHDVGLVRREDDVVRIRVHVHARLAEDAAKLRRGVPPEVPVLLAAGQGADAPPVEIRLRDVAGRMVEHEPHAFLLHLQERGVLLRREVFAVQERDDLVLPRTDGLEVLREVPVERRARPVVRAHLLQVEGLRNPVRRRLAVAHVELAFRLRDDGDLGEVRARQRQRFLAPPPAASDRVHDPPVAEVPARQVHEPEPHAVRKRHPELAVENRQRLVDVLREGAAVGTLLEPLEVRHVVPLVDEELAVEGCRGEVLAHLPVLPGTAAVVGVRRGEAVEVPRTVGPRDRAVVALERPPLVLRVAVEDDGRQPSARDLLHDPGVEVEHVDRHAVHALEVVGDAAARRRIPPALPVEAEALRHARNLRRGEVDPVVPPGLAQRPDGAVLLPEVAAERRGHRRGDVPEAALLRRIVRPAGDGERLPAEVLAPRPVRHVDAHEPVAVLRHQLPHGLGVARRDLVPRLPARERLPDGDVAPGRRMRVGPADGLAGIRGDPPVRRRGEKTRQDRGGRIPAEQRVQRPLLELRGDPSVLPPVGVLVVESCGEARVEADAGCGQRPDVLLLRDGLPEEERGDGTPAAQQTRRAADLTDPPAIRSLGRARRERLPQGGPLPGLRLQRRTVQRHAGEEELAERRAAVRRRPHPGPGRAVRPADGDVLDRQSADRSVRLLGEVVRRGVHAVRTEHLRVLDRQPGAAAALRARHLLLAVRLQDRALLRAVAFDADVPVGRVLHDGGAAEMDAQRDAAVVDEVAVLEDDVPVARRPGLQSDFQRATPGAPANATLDANVLDRRGRVMHDALQHNRIVEGVDVGIADAHALRVADIDAVGVIPPCAGDFEMRELKVGRIERLDHPAGRIHHDRTVDPDFPRIDDSNRRRLPVTIAVVPVSPVSCAADDARTGDHDILDVLRLKGPDHGRLPVDVHAIVTSQLHDLRLVQSGTEHDIRRLALGGEITPRVDEDLKRTMKSVELQRIITALRHAEADLPVLDDGNDSGGQRTHHRRAKAAVGPHAELRRTVRLHRHESRDLGLVRRTLVARRPLVERHRRNANRPHLHGIPVHPHRVPGIRREERLQNPPRGLGHALVARMRRDTRMREKARCHHSGFACDIRPDERDAEVAGRMRHLLVLRIVLPEDAAHHDVGTRLAAHEKSEQVLNRLAIGQTIRLRRQVRHVLADCHNQVVRCKPNDIAQSVRDVVFTKAPLEVRDIPHKHIGLASRLLLNPLRDEMHVIALRRARRHSPLIRPADLRRLRVQGDGIAEKGHANASVARASLAYGNRVHRLRAVSLGVGRRPPREGKPRRHHQSEQRPSHPSHPSSSVIGVSTSSHSPIFRGTISVIVSPDRFLSRLIASRILSFGKPSSLP